MNTHLSNKLDRVLLLIARLVVCISEQVNQAFLKKGCLSSTRYDLHLYHEEGKYLDRLYVRFHDKGAPRNAWKLRKKGYLYLANAGVPNLIKPSDNRNQTTIQLVHSIVSNWPIVWAMEVCRLLPYLSLAFSSEPELRHDHFKREYAIKSGQTVAQLPVIPDSWVQIKKEPQGELVFCFEVDRHTEERHSASLQDVKYKLLNYLDVDGSEDYSEIFGTKHILVVFLFASPKRQEAVMRLATRVLEDVKKLYQADLFLFGKMPDPTEGLTGEDFYFNQLFQRLEGEPTTLLPQTWREDETR